MSRRRLLNVMDDSKTSFGCYEQAVDLPTCYEQAVDLPKAEILYGGHVYKTLS